MIKYIINTITNEFVIDDGNLGARFRKEPFRKATPEETIQHNTEIEQEFLQKEKELAINAKVKELTPKSITETITQEEKDELQNLINS